MLFPGEQIVHLQRVEATARPRSGASAPSARSARPSRSTPSPPRTAPPAGRAPSAMADDGLGRPVHRRAVDHRPPALKNAAMTSALSPRQRRSLPTLKVIQVPRPTIGMASRVEGMSRRAGGACPGHAGRLATARVAAVAREARTNVRRVVRIRVLHDSGSNFPDMQPRARPQSTMGQVDIARSTAFPSNSHARSCQR